MAEAGAFTPWFHHEIPGTHGRLCTRAVRARRRHLPSPAPDAGHDDWERSLIQGAWMSRQGWEARADSSTMAQGDVQEQEGLHSPVRRVRGIRGLERAGPTRTHPEPGRDPVQRRRVLWGRPHGRRGRRGRPSPASGGWVFLTRGGAAAARWAHNPKVGGSNPSPATTTPGATVQSVDTDSGIDVFAFCLGLRLPNDALTAVGTALLDVVYPRRCAGCGTRGTWLCERCEAALACFTTPLCRCCGIPEVLDVCRCDDLPASIERVRSIGPYDGWLRGAVVQVKYHGEWARVAQLALLLGRASEDVLPADALVPVPLHPSRQKQRGFNQTEKLAHALSSEIALPVDLALTRTRKTTPQVRLDAVGRQGNVEGAFALAPGADVRGKRLVLVDDVITTGATLGACAQLLMAAGAAGVSVVTVAREL